MCGPGPYDRREDRRIRKSRRKGSERVCEDACDGLANPAQGKGIPQAGRVPLRPGPTGIPPARPGGDRALSPPRVDRRGS